MDLIGKLLERSYLPTSEPELKDLNEQHTELDAPAEPEIPANVTEPETPVEPSEAEAPTGPVETDARLTIEMPLLDYIYSALSSPFNNAKNVSEGVNIIFLSDL